MRVDNALADFTFPWNVDGGDTGTRGVEHRGLLQFIVRDRSEVRALR
jgi:hypothetical protein